MKPSKTDNVIEEIAEVHVSGRSPSPKQRTKSRSRSRSSTRKLSNGHSEDTAPIEVSQAQETTDSRRENWISSEQNESIELPIHEQLKQGILGFVEKEFKKSDGTKPSFVFYSHDPNGLDEKYLKTLSRPSSGHKEKRSPSYKRKKRHSSRHRDKELQEFEMPGSSLSALEKVDDYLKEYNGDEIVTLSGELELHNGQNNNGSAKELRNKPRKTRRKVRDERQEAGPSSKDDSPKVFKTGKNKALAKPARPTELTAMLDSLEARPDAYIDNPFSSPSPVTSPSDERANPFDRRMDKVYLQGGGTFRAVSRDRILQDSRDKDEDKYFRFGELTPIDIALSIQRGWRRLAAAGPGVLAGLALMHLLLLGADQRADGRAAGAELQAMLAMPYVAAYYFFCVLCLVSVLDRLDPLSMDLSSGLAAHFQGIVLVILYASCLLVSTATHHYDLLMVDQYMAEVTRNGTGNGTLTAVPQFYSTWTHLSIWRAVLAVLGLAYYVMSTPTDAVYTNVTKLLHFKSPLQRIG